MTSARTLAPLLLLAALAACDVPPAETVPARNVELIRALPATLRLAPFPPSAKSVDCAGTPITLSGVPDFAAAVRATLSQAIVAAQDGATRPRTLDLQARLRDITADCGAYSASWTIALDVTINGAPAFPIRINRLFDGGFAGANVAARAREALPPAFDQLVNAILTSPKLQAAARRQ